MVTTRSKTRWELINPYQHPIIKEPNSEDVEINSYLKQPAEEITCPDEKVTIMKDYHDSGFGGHFGATKTRMQGLKLNIIGREWKITYVGMYNNAGDVR